MKNKMLSIVASLVLVLLASQIAFSQSVQFRVDLALAIGTARDTITIGISGDGPGGAINDNTYNLDPAGPIYGPFGLYGESAAPPGDPDGNRVRIVDIPGRTTIGGGLFRYDFRGFTSTSQIDTFAMRIDGLRVETTGVTVSWPNNLSTLGTSWILYARAGATLTQVANMLTSTSYTFAPTGSNIQFVVIKTGIVVTVPGPVFSLSASALNFGTVTIPGTASQNVTVSNPGTTNALSITGITSIANYTVSPSAFPITIAPGGNQVFTVTFAPAAPGTFAGNIAFAHNAPGAPTNLAVTGVGTTAPSQGGTLQYAASARTRFDATNGYTDSLQLVNYVGQPLQALQFHVVFNGLMRLRTITRGTSVPSASFGFDYTIARGAAQANGASNDTIKAVIYGLGTNTLAPGTYNNMMKFSYDVVNISAPDTQATSIGLTRVFGSLALGGDALVTNGGAQNVTVINRTRAYRGDVNGDDRVDILDLLDVVDHIIERRLLTGTSFTAADVAPWPAGDNVVNVQDLSLLQNIILTGQYPDGTPLTKPLGSGGTVALLKGNSTLSTFDAKVTLYITAEGIAVRMENFVPVKGMQLEFGNVASAPEPINISTLLGQGYSKHSEDILRVLLYNQQASVIEPGDRLVANIPFAITDPQAIELDRIVIANGANKGLGRIDVNISYENSPELPTEYALFQNYPNPFNPSTTVKFQIPTTSRVRISIFNALGQELATLFDAVAERGTKAVQFDGKDKNGNVLPSGMYLYRMTAGSFVSSKKMMFLK